LILEEAYLFFEGTPPGEYSEDFSATIFHNTRHLFLQDESNWYSYYILQCESNTIQAIIHFHVKDGEAKSPLQSPFGSVLFSEHLSLQVLFKFLVFVEEQLRLKGVKQITIKNPPELYFPESIASLQVLLFNLNYQVSRAEIGSLIPVGKEVYLDKLEPWERRKYHMAVKKGFDVRQLSVVDLEDVYLFIARCREVQSRKLSLSWEQLKRIADTFTDRFVLFAIYQSDVLVAASINLVVTKDVLYNFYGAHDRQFNKYSPVVMLMNTLYTYCQTNGFTYLDLGTSATGNEPNFSLLDFKVRLGAKSTQKLTFQKTL
jgi:hypothetical protein